MTKRTRWIAVLALLAVGGTLVVLKLGAPGDLERLNDASETAGQESETITANLERIADNLAEGMSLSGDTSEIRELTEEQQASLKRLAALLKEQLAALGASAEALEGAEETTSALAQLSRAQARILRRTVQALQDLRGYAGAAAEASAEVDEAARYGARLAEDSERAFSQ